LYDITVTGLGPLGVAFAMNTNGDSLKTAIMRMSLSPRLELPIKWGVDGYFKTHY
jgi:hypothetical protein